MSGPEAFGTNPYSENTPVEGELVTILRGVTMNRGLRLESYRSRAVTRGQVHELMMTDDLAEPGVTCNRVGLIGFFVVRDSGVLLVDTPVSIAGRVVGNIAGFDDTHMPNHQNICLRASELADGVELGLHAGDRVEIAGRPAT